MSTHIALPPDTLEAFRRDELRARVFYEKYSLRDKDGHPAETTPAQMWDRITAGLAAVEPDSPTRTHWQREFRWLLGDFRFLPGGRILHAIGQSDAGRKAVPTNCFVIPVKGDTLEDIYECAKEMAKTYSRGGGVGIDISCLRPKGAVVHNAAHESTGAVSFMETFSLVTGTIGQSGRRGALMITIRDDHPDVLDFVRIKRDRTSVRYANISVLVSDAFMRAVDADAEWRLHYDNADAGVSVERTIKARELWSELIQGARDWAEPGCLFIDSARRRGTTEYNGMQVLTTNPCCPAGTRVAVPGGWRPVEDIKPGDHILTVNGIRQVARVERYSNVPVYRVQMSDGGVVRATAAHQFHACPAHNPVTVPNDQDTTSPVRSFSPRRLETLRPGDYLRMLAGDAQIVSITPDGIEDVFDLYEPVTDTWIAEGYVSRGCGEQFLDPYNNCNLGALNLLTFVRHPFASVAPHENVNWDDLRRAIRAGVRFLDNVITYSEPLFPLEAQREAASRSRRIGLGITGLGDLLAAVRLRYDSDEAITFASTVAEFIKLDAYRASVDLAGEKGAFPGFDADQHLRQEFFQDFPADVVTGIRETGLRNAALLTVAPTGSISAMAGITSGIEPIFALSYQRRSESLSQDRFLVAHPLVGAYIDATGMPLPPLPAFTEADGLGLPAFFVTAHDIDPLQRVRMQAAIAHHIDNSLSSTINLPRDASIETVHKVYRLAWELGCKGITCYREGSREGILITQEEARRTSEASSLATRVRAIAASAVPDLALNGGSPDQQIEEAVRTLADRLKGSALQLSLTNTEVPVIHPRGTVLPGFTHQVRTAMGSMFVTISEQHGRPIEIFCRLGKGGSHAEADSEMAGRLISLLLRADRLPDGDERLELIREQLAGIGGGDSYGFGPNRVRSIADAIAKAISDHLEYKRERSSRDATGREDARRATVNQALHTQAHTDLPPAPIAGGSNGNLCPRCQQFSLILDHGCTRCKECGFKEC